jgi:hypothetical protein
LVQRHRKTHGVYIRIFIVEYGVVSFDGIAVFYDVAFTHIIQYQYRIQLAIVDKIVKLFFLLYYFNIGEL